jgi:hypothetical protein
VVEADADLQDPVVQTPDRDVGRAPERLEGLVLLEELAAVELLDRVRQLVRRRVVAPRPGRLAGDGLALRAAFDLAGSRGRRGVGLVRPWRARP